jgi:uncharacterized membrane protein
MLVSGLDPQDLGTCGKLRPHARVVQPLSSRIKSMNVVKVTVAAALAAAISVPFAVVAQAQETEKCLGVVKAGKNDCQTASSSCAGTSKKDAQADAWIAVPKGTCAKIVGGKVAAK